MDWNTGRLLTDETAHIVQSLRMLFSTPFKSRVMRRDLGCPQVDLIDAPGNPLVVSELTVGLVEAVDRWEGDRAQIRHLQIGPPDIEEPPPTEEDGRGATVIEQMTGGRFVIDLDVRDARTGETLNVRL